MFWLTDVQKLTESQRPTRVAAFQAEREKTTGEAWFNMKAPEVTQELKGDLRVLKMRGSLDPKRFYKKNDRDGFPKYFQVCGKKSTKHSYFNAFSPRYLN